MLGLLVFGCDEGNILARLGFPWQVCCKKCSLMLTEIFVLVYGCCTRVQRLTRKDRRYRQLKQHLVSSFTSLLASWCTICSAVFGTASLRDVIALNTFGRWPSWGT